MCQNGVRAKETEVYIAELSVFFKGQNAHKTFNVLLLESAFEELSFRSFLKASD